MRTITLSKAFKELEIRAGSNAIIRLRRSRFHGMLELQVDIPTGNHIKYPIRSEVDGSKGFANVITWTPTW